MPTADGAIARRDRQSVGGLICGHQLATEEMLADYDIIARPIPGTSQELAVTSPCDITLIYGNRGGGKTQSLLMSYARELDKGYGPEYVGIILGYEQQSLDNIVRISKKLFNNLPGAELKASFQHYKWVFRGGEELWFRYVSDPRQYDSKVHGNSLAFLGVEESTNWPEPGVIDMVSSTLRTGFDPLQHSPDPNNPLPELKCRIVLCCNPSGDGRLWHKARYIDIAHPGTVTTKRYSFTLRGSDGTPRNISRDKSQVAIFSSFVENTYISEDEIASLLAACENDPILQAMWIEGRWDVSGGGALDDLWLATKHVLPQFVVPESWHVDRSHDWGSSQPSATLIFAESDGGEVEIDGCLRTFPPGTLFVIDEVYTSKKSGYNEGTRATPDVVAELILATERGLMERGIISKRLSPGPADHSMWSVKQTNVPCIADQMTRSGVPWLRADLSVSRINGLQLIRQMLMNSIKGEGPGLYVTQNCRQTIRLVPPIRRDKRKPEDADTKAEDHLYDALRYKVSAAKRITATTVEFIH